MPDQAQSAAAPTTRKGICQQVRDLYYDHYPFWQPYHDAMTNEEEFLDGDRYQQDYGEYNRDRRLVQIRGQETQDTIRHVVAKATEKPRSIEARPIDSAEDADMAEIAVSLVEWETGNPWKEFDDCYEAAITACREKRLGILWMDWDPECGQFGEILFNYQDARRIMWDPSYSPHHPKSGWLIREKRLDVGKAREEFDAPWLQPDKDAINATAEFKPGIPLIRGAAGDRIPNNSMTYRDNKCTIWECWYKNDQSTKEAPGDPADYQPIDDPEQRYLACDQCNYRSPTQGELRAKGKIQNELPDDIPGACPDCGGNLRRIDAKEKSTQILAYSKGRRLVIMAPYSPSPDDDPLYDGGWPIPDARSYPALFLTAYIKPGRPMGPSDTTLMWDQQIASDNLRTIAVQRAFEHRNYWVFPRTGIYDIHGGRFECREDQYNIMFRDMTRTNMGPLDIQLLNGTGLDPGWQVAFNATQSALVQYRGVTDLGLTPDSTKNIAASTVAQLNQMGEIPVAHFNRRKNRELGKFYGVLWDYIRAVYTPDRIARLRMEGVDILGKLQGDDLPNFDFVLADTPEFTGLEKEKADAFQTLLQMAMNPMTMPFLDLFAQVNNLPRSIVRQIEKTISGGGQLAPPNGAPQNAGPVNGAPQLGPLAQLVAGGGMRNGGGMVPQSAS